MTLHEELHRIADRARVADVPADTWSGGRRALRRDRALRVGAAAATVAVVAGLIAWLPTDRSEPPPAAGAAPGVPGTIYALPNGVASDPDLRVGRAAAAYTVDDTELSRIVVVAADDGSYHGLDLPGVEHDPLTSPTVSLSPDGRSLAYYSADGQDTGLGVLDLLTGDVVTIPLRAQDEDDRPVRVDQLTWSADSRWLLWTGHVITKWTRLSRAYGGPLAGRVPPGGDTSETLPRGDWGAGGISDTGEVVVVRDQLIRWDGRRVMRTPVAAPAASTYRATRVGPASVTELRTTARGPILTRYAAATRSARAPELQTRVAQVLGWLDDATAVISSNPRDDILEASDLGLLRLSEGGRRASFRKIGTRMSYTEQLSLATDLMSAEQPVVDRPPPAWVDDGDGRTWALLAGLAGGLVIALAGLALAARHRLVRRHSAD